MDPKFKILLVEDESAHAELVERAFEERDREVQLCVVPSLFGARKALLDPEYLPDLIIADWRLPDGDGMELLSESSRDQNIPVVIMTSHGNERIAVDAMKAGALDYVVKTTETLVDMPHIAERAVREWQILNERSHMQSALRESEARFRLLAENSTDLIARLSTNRQFIYVSPASRYLLGYEPEEMISLSMDSLIHPDDLINLEVVFSELFEKMVVPPVTYRILRKDGHYLWLETSFRAILDEMGQSFEEIHATSRDITERKQAEVAIQRAHTDLKEAYDATIEGWSRALELRDIETEGHSRRVTDMTLALARSIGIREESDLLHIRWGALLHDIGKMGISDELLQKPGPLNESEWVEMKRHPHYAHDMLYPIAYLRPAIEIPLYHHERWDGSGYPYGLEGEHIPITARLFAIVDVWDALRTNRPYRLELPRIKVLDYILENAGVLFDPHIVEVFMKLENTVEPLNTIS